MSPNLKEGLRKMSCGEKRKEKKGDNSQKDDYEQMHETKKQDGAWNKLQAVLSS